MRIDRVSVSDFQVVKEAEVKLGGLTMIYGANSSGKSSIGDAILYALTGQQARGRVLADAIREGSRGLDADGKRLVMRWVSGLVRGGCQVLMLTSAPAPEVAPPGVTAYAMSEGIASAIAGKGAAA